MEIVRLTVYVAALLTAPSATWACGTTDEPTLAQLSAAALRASALEPERMRSLIARARRAALLPRVRFSAGRGGYDYVRNADSLEPSIVSSDTWRYEVDVIFSLDRLIFDPHELRAVEAASRVAEHRLDLLQRVAEIWVARRSLARTFDPASPTQADDSSSREERCIELTVLLDSLTDGALSRGVRVPKSLRVPPGRP